MYLCRLAYGYSSTSFILWHFETPQIREEASVEHERQKILMWFDKKVFTEDEKRAIYKMFQAPVSVVSPPTKD